MTNEFTSYYSVSSARDSCKEQISIKVHARDAFIKSFTSKFKAGIVLSRDVHVSLSRQLACRKQQHDRADVRKSRLRILSTRRVSLLFSSFSRLSRTRTVSSEARSSLSSYSTHSTCAASETRDGQAAVFVHRAHCYGYPKRTREEDNTQRNISIYHGQISVL